MKKHRTRHSFHPKIAYILRATSSLQHKIQPVVNKEEYTKSTLETNEILQKAMTISEKIQTLSSSQKPDSPIEQIKSPVPDATQHSNISPMLQKTPGMTLNMVEPQKGWWKQLTPKQTLTLKIVVVLILSIIVIAAVAVPSVLTLVVFKTNSESSFTNLTSSVCSSTTCIGKETPYRTSMTTVLYPFDGHVMDLMTSSVGVVIGPDPTPYQQYSYIGTQTLYINHPSTVQQYIQIPYINLSQKSFTIELWLNILTSVLTTDYGIFSQCDLNNICLLISLRNGRFVLSFDAMNSNNTLTGNTINQNNQYLHLAVVYDAVLYQQQIYIDGQLDAMSNAKVMPFQGTASGSVTTIGRSVSSIYGPTYFTGRIDHLTISAGSARTACQIYNDATLTAYFPFDLGAVWNDYSANLLHGFGVGESVIPPGRSGQAIYFGSNTSFFQSRCFLAPQTWNPPFSIAFWVNAYNPRSGGSIVHISYLQNGNGSNCYDLLALTATGTLVVQLMQSTSLVNTYEGPSIPSNSWMHLTVVYGPKNGVRVYMDGQITTMSSSTATITFNYNNEPFYLTLANNSPLGPTMVPNCRNGSIPILPGPFNGAIDEFRLYSRELTNQEICKLADR